MLVRFVIRGTLMVAVTEFGSGSKPFSSRLASRLIEFVVGFGGGAIVNVAEIF